MRKLYTNIGVDRKDKTFPLQRIIKPYFPMFGSITDVGGPAILSTVEIRPLWRLN